jgi:hypothetical protein
VQLEGVEVGDKIAEFDPTRTAEGCHKGRLAANYTLVASGMQSNHACRLRRKPPNFFALAG